MYIKFKVQFKVSVLHFERKELTMKLIRDKSIDFTFETSVNTELFNEFFGVDKAILPDMYDIEFVQYVQKRKHKKKRINKKWLKKYGYKMIKKKAKGWKMNVDTNGNVEFVKDKEG